MFKSFQFSFNRQVVLSAGLRTASAVFFAVLLVCGTQVIANESDPCEAALTSPVSNYVRLIQMAVESKELNLKQIQDLSAEKLNPFATGLNAHQRKLQNALATNIQRMKAEDRKNALRKIEEVLGLQSSIEVEKSKANVRTRKVLAPKVVATAKMDSVPAMDHINILTPDGQDERILAVSHSEKITFKKFSTGETWDLFTPTAGLQIQLKSSTKGEIFYLAGSAEIGWSVGRLDKSGPRELSTIPAIGSGKISNNPIKGPPKIENPPGLEILDDGGLRIFGFLNGTNRVHIYDGLTGRLLRDWRVIKKHETYGLNHLSGQLIDGRVVISISMSAVTDGLKGEALHFLILDEKQKPVFQNPGRFVRWRSGASFGTSNLLQINNKPIVIQTKRTSDSTAVELYTPTDRKFQFSRLRSLWWNFEQKESLIYKRFVAAKAWEFSDLFLCSERKTSHLDLKDRLIIVCIDRNIVTVLELNKEYEFINSYQRELPDDSHLEPKIHYDEETRELVLTTKGSAFYLFHLQESGPLEIYRKDWPAEGRVSDFYRRRDGGLYIDFTEKNGSEESIHTVQIIGVSK